MDFLVLTKAGGILSPIGNALGVIMDALFKFTSSFGVMNIGLCIILFTIVVKLLMFPLTLKQQKFSKLTSVMQPEILAIQKKYKGKKDQDSMMRMNMETKAIYEKYGTSMTGGCLQMVIQLPIMFALYRVIYNIPAYVPSVRVFFDNVVNPLMKQPDYINKIADLAKAAKMPIDSFNYAISDKVVDLLYKFTPSQWESLKGIFPSMTDTITQNADKIESMNSFLGINLATAPWSGMIPTIAWLIPLLAGLSQWYSTKLMTSTQAMAADAPGANTMKQMNTMMPIMSAVFCFTFPAAIGIYWIASSVLQIIQQVCVNAYLDKIDIDELVRKNIEKANAKRAKKGLPPSTISHNATANLKKIQSEAEKEEEKRAEKLEKSMELMKESTEYYSSHEVDPNSLTAKAHMVQKYNEKHNKK